MKKILRGRILIHGFSEPFGINFEGLDGLFLCTRHFIQIHLGVVCGVLLICHHFSRGTEKFPSEIFEFPEATRGWKPEI